VKGEDDYHYQGPLDELESEGWIPEIDLLHLDQPSFDGLEKLTDIVRNATKKSGPSSLPK
jgi:hypothetical protein